MLREFGFARPVEIIQRRAAAGHRHQQGLAAPPNLRTLPICPIHVGGDKAYTARPPGTANGRGETREIQCRAQPLGVNGAREADRPADVLLVDHAVGERDLASETSGEPVRLGVRPNERGDLLGRPVCVVCDANRVDALRIQPTLQETADQTGSAELVVADGVNRDFSDRPQLAQRRTIPLSWVNPSRNEANPSRSSRAISMVDTNVTPTPRGGQTIEGVSPTIGRVEDCAHLLACSP